MATGIGTPVLLDSGGTDTDARDYTTANNISPTPGRTVLAAIGVYDAGNALTTPVCSGCGLVWTAVSAIGGGAGEPDIFVYRASGSGAVTSGKLTFTGCVSAGQTADGAIWSVVEVPGTDLATNDGVIQYQGVTGVTTNTDSLSASLAALRDAESVACSFILSFDNAGGALTLTAGTSYTMLTQFSQTAGAATMRMGFQYRLTNTTTVDCSAAAANDRLEQLPMELGSWKPRSSGLYTPHAVQRKSRR